MIAEVLAVGTELLMGQIANTNAQYISRRLPDVGIGVFFHSVVGDNPIRVKSSLTLALSRADIVILTGGLGPTQDDLTKEAVAETLGKKMIIHEKSLETIKLFFEKLGRKMVDSNARQAYFPEGSIIMENGKGTAPGCIVESDGKIIVLLPGPPSEMKPMFENSVMPFLESKSSDRLESKYIKSFGIGESSLEDIIMDLVDKQSNPTIATYAKDSEVTIRVTARYPKNTEFEDVLTPVVDEITKRLGDAVYSLEDKGIENVTTQLLIDKNISIGIAESCTGGIIASRLTSVSGASKIFSKGVVTYSNQAKIDLLGVKADTLEKHGAVSKETACEMAQGILSKSNSIIGVSITGIAGPDGGSEEKPVGLVYIGLADKNGVEAHQFNFWGDRERIRNVTALNVFNLIRKKVNIY